MHHCPKTTCGTHSFMSISRHSCSTGYSTHKGTLLVAYWQVRRTWIFLRLGRTHELCGSWVSPFGGLVPVNCDCIMDIIMPWCSKKQLWNSLVIVGTRHGPWWEQRFTTAHFFYLPAICAMCALFICQFVRKATVGPYGHLLVLQQLYMRQVGYNRGGESSATVVILILFLAANEKHHPRVDRYNSCLCYSKVSQASTKSVKRTAGLKHTATVLFWGRKENAGVYVWNDPCTTDFFNSDANKAMFS
jgi:hypothetical protein